MGCPPAQTWGRVQAAMPLRTRPVPPEAGWGGPLKQQPGQGHCWRHLPRSRGLTTGLGTDPNKLLLQLHPGLVDRRQLCHNTSLWSAPQKDRGSLAVCVSWLKGLLPGLEIMGVCFSRQRLPPCDSDGVSALWGPGASRSGVGSFSTWGLGTAERWPSREPVFFQCPCPLS